MRMRKLLLGMPLVAIACLLLPGQASALLPSQAWPLVKVDDKGNPAVDPTSEGIEVKDRAVLYPPQYITDIGDATNPQDGTLRRVLMNLGPSANVTIVIKKKGNSNSYTVDAPIHIGSTQPTTQITIRGETNDPRETILNGKYLTSSVFELHNASNITFAHMTVTSSNKALILLHGKDNPNLGNIRFYRCDLLNSNGQGIIYAEGDPASGVTQNCTVEFCNIGYTTFPDIDQHSDFGNANGIVVIGGIHWVIRHNLFFWIIPCQKDTSAANYNNDLPVTGGRWNTAVYMQNNSKDTEIYGNTFSYCEAPITIGDKKYSDGGGGEHAHFGGVIKNNTFYFYTRQIPYPSPGWPGWLHEYPFIVIQDAHDEIKIVHNSGAYYSGTSTPWIHLYHPGTSGYVLKNNVMNITGIEEDDCSGTKTPNIEDAVVTPYGAPGTNGEYYKNDSNTAAGLPTNHANLTAMAPPNDGAVGAWSGTAPYFAWLHNHWEYNPLLGHFGTYGLPVANQEVMAVDFHLNPTASNNVASDIIDEAATLSYASDDWDTGARQQFKTAVEALGGDSVGAADMGADEWNVTRPAWNFDTGGGGDSGAKPSLNFRTGNTGRTPDGLGSSLQNVRDLIMQRRSQRTSTDAADNARQSQNEQATSNWIKIIKQTKTDRKDKRRTPPNTSGGLSQDVRTGGAR